MDQNQKSQRTPIVERFFSKVPGSKFIFANGVEITFKHGFFDLKEHEHQEAFLILGNKEDPRNHQRCFDVYLAELNDLVAKGNPLIFKHGFMPPAMPSVGADRNARAEAEIMASELAARNVTGRVTGDVNAGPIGAANTSDVNSSAVDPALRDKLLGPSPTQVGPGKTLQDIRNEAALRASAGAKNGSAQ
jgi:hypothetical protein